VVILSEAFMENNKSQIARELWKRINKRIEEILDYKSAPSEDKLKRIVKNLNHAKNYFNDNSFEFSDNFREKFRKLYYEGVQAGLFLKGNLTELYLLKDDIEKDVYKNVLTTDKQKAVIISFYHLGNMVLFFFLLRYLNLL